MRDIIVTVIIFGLVPFILTRPWLGVLVWSWIGYMNPHRLTWGFAFSFPFASVIGAATLFAWLISKEPKKIPWTPVTITLLLFTLWMNVTTPFAFNQEEAWFQWDKVMKIMLMTFVTISVMQTRTRINLLVWVIALSLAFFGVKGGIFTILTGGQHMVLGPPGSFIGTNTELALALIMALPLLRYLQQQLSPDNKWGRRALTAAMILIGFAIVGSYSRGALVGGVAMLAFLWLKSNKKLLVGIILILAVPPMLMFMPGKWMERMYTIQTYEEDGSAMGRINAWGYAINLAKDRPLVGGGFECWTHDLFQRWAPNPYQVNDAHSIYFEVLGEQGIPGLTLFLLFALFVWRTGTWIIRTAKERDDMKWALNLAAMVHVSLVGYAVGGAFLGLAYFDLFYSLAALLVLTRCVMEKQLAAEREAVPEPVSDEGLTLADPVAGRFER